MKYKTALRRSTLTVRRAERPALQMGSGSWQTGRVYADIVDAPHSTSVRKTGTCTAGRSPR